MSTTAPTLEDRVSALEAQLANALADNLQPNVLTVEPDGTIGAEFTGHVHAEGLDLDAGTLLSPPDINRVRWLRATDRAVVADEFAWAVPNGEGFRFTSYALLPADGNGVILAATDDQDNDQASLFVSQLARGSGLAKATAGAQASKIIGADGASDFIQVPGRPGNRQLALAGGLVALAFNNTIGQKLPIAHGLGRTPIAAGVFAIDGSEFLTVQQAAVPDNTNLYVSANVNATRDVHWFAIG